MLHDLLLTNSKLLIERCNAMGGSRSDPMATAAFSHGIPVFLQQLVETLILEQGTGDIATSLSAIDVALSDTAALHGRDLFDAGMTIGQVVRDYGILCQAVMNLAYQTDLDISVPEFRTFNRCLDYAIAAAVSEYARCSPAATQHDPQILDTRMGRLAHELRNHLHTANLVVSALKTGDVGIGGATAGVLDRSLKGMRSLVDRSLAEVRITAGLAPRPQDISIATLLKEAEATATLEARAKDCHFSVGTVSADVRVNADRELLAAAVGNLLHNAFKFTKRHSQVWLRAKATSDRVLIEVEDRCGGLPDGAPERLLQPFFQAGPNRSGLGLGLDICRRGVEANGGMLKIRDIPGSGCAFTIDLPRLYPVPPNTTELLGD